jgi:mono/diheme cytochrome c family protein
LLYTINKGGTEMGGQMPAFEKRLSKEEKQALIDYMYNLWPKEIQTRYDQKFK